MPRVDGLCSRCRKHKAHRKCSYCQPCKKLRMREITERQEAAREGRLSFQLDLSPGASRLYEKELRKVESLLLRYSARLREMNPRSVPPDTVQARRKAAAVLDELAASIDNRLFGI